MSSSLASTFSRLFSNDTPTSAIDFLSNWNDLDRKSNFNRYGSQLTTMAIGFGEEDNYQLSHYAKGISEFQSRDTNLDDNQLKSLLTTMALGEEENDKINRCNTEAIGGENYNSILPGGCYPSSTFPPKKTS